MARGGASVVVRNGVYGDRMADTNVNMLDFGTGRPVDLDRLDALCSSRKVDWAAIVHHETTTGLLNPLGVVLQIAAAHGCKLLVDALAQWAPIQSMWTPKPCALTRANALSRSRASVSLPGSLVFQFIPSSAYLTSVPMPRGCRRFPMACLVWLRCRAVRPMALL
jgi:hypothetical protein